MKANDLFGYIGFWGLIFGFLTCILTFISSIAAIRLNRLRSKIKVDFLVHLQTLFLGLSIFSLAILLLVNAFEYPLVFNAVEISMPWIQKLGGLWAGQAASLLFWAFLMSSATSITLLVSKQIKKINYAPYLSIILEFTLLFFIAPNIFYTHPFDRTWILADGTNLTSLFPPPGAMPGAPLDGIGLNPSLRHPSMLLHPPFLYLGLIFFFIPYAFALSSLIRGDQDDHWVKLSFPFAILAWVFLTIGMFLGSWWAYTILGWGGFWSWDAVEISGLLPWLLSFGLIHSFRVHLSGYPFKRWLIVLSSLIVILILFGILLTRSGIIDSIHAYVSGTMGPLLTVLILVHLTLVVIFLEKCWKILGNISGSDFIPLSIQLVGLFNIGLILLAGFYLFGQTLPLTSQFLLPERMSLAPAQYEYFSSPLIILLIVITAFFPIAHLVHDDYDKFKRALFTLVFVSFLLTLFLLIFVPASAGIAIGIWAIAFLVTSWLYVLWNDFFIPSLMKHKNERGSKKRISLESILTHLAFALISIGIVGVINYSTQQDLTIPIGEETKIGGATFKVSSSKNYVSNEGRIIYEVQLSMTDQGGRNKIFNPSIEYYPKMESLYAKPSLQLGFQRDVQVVLGTLPNVNDDKVNIRISIFPLMGWIWMGGILLVISGLFILSANYRKILKIY
jgi:cytochrome c-type biogenesis protein CcmF